MNNDYLEGMTTVQQRNVTSIYEPQNPLYHKEKDAYFYPLTSEKQIVMDDGRRLNAVLEEDFAKKDEVNSAKAEAIDSSKVYTNEQIKKAAHRNLLDNSDFRNPVNQRGGNNLDRWTFVNVAFSGNTLLSFQSDGIVITNDAGADRVCLYQKFIEKNFDGKTYAAYIMTSDGLYSGYVETIKEDEGIRQCNFWIPTGSKVIWSSIYEGEYTAETLPEYQPKGYGVELAECQRYLQRFRTSDLRKTYCEDFRPTMRMTDTGIVSTFELSINDVTYYFASAEL